MQTAHERVGKALDLLTTGLYPFVERELKAVYKDDWINAARRSFRENRGQGLPKGEVIRWDAHTMLTVIWDQWNSVFRHKLDQPERSLISELREFRNRWAHQAEFDFDDTYRILDSVQRLLSAVSAEEAAEIAKEKRELLRGQFTEDVNAVAQKREFNRDRWTVVILSVVCGSAIIGQIANADLGFNGMMLGIFVSMFFVYVIISRLRHREPTFGPHECQKCGKIIYSDPCPYCESPSVAASSD